jgi:hypothetical protein
MIQGQDKSPELYVRVQSLLENLPQQPQGEEILKKIYNLLKDSQVEQNGHATDIADKLEYFQLKVEPLNKALFAFWRQSIDRHQSIFCIHNLSNETQNLVLSELNLIDTEVWCDLIGPEAIKNIYTKYILKPHQCLWITNKFKSSELNGHQ